MWIVTFCNIIIYLDQDWDIKEMTEIKCGRIFLARKCKITELCENFGLICTGLALALVFGSDV